MLRIDCRKMTSEDRVKLDKYLEENIDPSLITSGIFQVKKTDYYVKKNKPLTDEQKIYILDLYDTIENKTNTIKLCQKNDIHLTHYLLNKILSDRVKSTSSSES